jgi:hypothetical protein
MTDKKLTTPLTTDISGENKDKKLNFSRMPYYVETPIREIDNDDFKQIKSDIEEINVARCLRFSENSIIVLTYYLYSKNYKKCDALAEYYERQAQKEKNEEIQRLQKDLKNQEIDHYQELYLTTNNPVYLKLLQHAKEKKDE